MPKRRTLKEVLNDGFLGMRIKPMPDKEYQLPISKKGKSLPDLLGELIDSSSMVDLSQLNSFRTIATDRESLYEVYDEMRNDSVISSALEMYADDATQYNREGSVIWVDSSEPNIAAFGNRLIDVLGLNTNAWSHIYSLVTYGDLYLETFTDDPLDNEDLEQDPLFHQVMINLRPQNAGYHMQEYIEMHANPAEIFDLVKRGKTVGYVKSPMPDKAETNNFTFKSSYVVNNVNANSETVYDPRKFIHISIGNDINRYPESVSIQFNLPQFDKDDKQKKRNKIRTDDGTDVRNYNNNGVRTSSSSTGAGTDGLSVKTYSVKRGQSILQDIYTTYQIVSLMEDAILLNRVTRSSIIRLLQVEVGDMSKSQVNTVLKRLKQMIEQRNMMDKPNGRFKSQASPGPVDNIIYVPTRNGKGTVTMSNIGGDVDVKSIADLDYFANKLYAGLKIPKSFLGQDIEGGLSAGSSLTKLDARYARTIKRIQNAYIQGITTLINLFALDKGLDDYVNKFDVKMVSPATTEDSEKDENMSTKMDLISSFIELLGEAYTEETKKEVFEYFVSTWLSDSTITEILSKDDEPEEEAMEDSEDEEGGFGETEPISGGGDDFNMDMDFGGDDSGFDDTSTDDFSNETSDDMDTSSDADFGDFSDSF